MGVIKKKVLFVGYGGGHITILDKIAEGLINDDGVEVLILPLNGAIPFIKKKYDEAVFCPLSKFASIFDKDIDKILGYGSSLLTENYNPNIGLSKFESMFYLGLSYYDLVLQTDEKTAAEIYRKRKRQAFYPYNVLTTIFSEIKPDLVITTTSPRFESAALKAAKDLGIQSLQILDLFGDDYPVPSADHIVVMNQSVSEKLRSRGNIESKFYPYGQPILDETIETINSLDIEGIKRNRGLSGKKILLFGPTRNYVFNEDLSIKAELDGTEMNNSIFAILDEVAEKFGIQIILRPHPSDHADNYIKFIADKPHYNVCPELSIYEAIAISDYVLSYSSTIVVQSVVSNKKSFTFNQNPDELYHWPELSKDPFIYSSDLVELRNNLIENMEDRKVVELTSFFEKGAVNKIKILIKKLTE
ncbi:glycosyltransferase family protein [Pedobacter caeni]|uniref:CDP-Glycerol:Poly(Glycerophosphate) glycerophosphotransferase n=1 Tax=Pedobacter caeni TaxID=288992 RepID=A0A1M5PR84_9SPHI|nr:hypothetical protein [Pedobacter caeni]SHH04096.1 hypothetical protein SAMN04488522_11051 [Pedobacter caeni]